MWPLKRRMPAESPATPLVFIHMPKSGGTSLTHALSRFYRPDQIKTDKGNLTVGLMRSEGSRSSGPVFYHGHPDRGVMPCLPPGANVFTILRKPADHAVSNFLQILSNPDGADYPAARSLGFSEFLRVSWWYAIFQTATLAAGLVEEPIVTKVHIEERHSAVLTLLERMCFVGVLEHAFASFDLLSERLNLSPAIRPPYLNTAAERGTPASTIDRFKAEYEALKEDNDLALLLALEEVTYQKALSILRQHLAASALRRDQHFAAPTE